MNNLKNSGLNLRTLQPTDYAKLVEDIQYNFTQILSSGGFKGSRGESIKGDTGIGIRGSKWIFVSLGDFENVQSINDLDLDFINTMFVDNPDDFKEHLTIPDDSDLVYGDTLVLPSGQIIQLVTKDTGDIFIDTGISFQQVSGLSASEVVSIVQSLMGTTQDNDGFKYFNAVAKNVDDSSPAQNQNLTQDSTIDAVVTGAGAGYGLPNHKFYAPSETQVTEDMFVMQVLGSIKRYHELVQATQQIHSNAYTAGYDDWASLAVLQNSYKNGILLGHKNSESIRNFGRIYKSENATIITSSYSPLVSEYSEINLFDNKITLRVQELIELKSRKLDFQGEEITTRSLSQKLTNNLLVLTLGLNNTKTIFDTNNLFLDKHKDANFLSTDLDGKVIKRFNVATDLNSNSATEIVTTEFLNNRLESIEDDVDELRDDVDELMNADTSINFKKLGVVTSSSPTNDKNLNNFTTFGYTTFKLDIIVDLVNHPFPSNDPQTPSYYDDSKAKLKVYCNKYVDPTTQEEMTYLEQKLSCVFISYMTTGQAGFDGNIYKEHTRYGVINTNGTIIWGQWKENVIGHGALNGDEIISRIGNNLSHAQKPNIASTQNTTTQVVKNIEFDSYGHAETVESIDLVSSGLSVPSGSVFHIATTTVPRGYLACRGQYVNAVQYPNLYRAIGSTFGAIEQNQTEVQQLGDGIIVGDSTGVPNVRFKLPDLRGQFIRGWNNLRMLSTNESENLPDTMRTFGSIQNGMVQRHKHATIWGENSTNSNWYPYGYIGNGTQWGLNNTNQGVQVDKDNYIPLTNDGSIVTGQGGALVANPNPDGAIGHETRPTNIALLAIIKV